MLHAPATTTCYLRFAAARRAVQHPAKKNVTKGYVVPGGCTLMVYTVVALSSYSFCLILIVDSMLLDASS